MLIPRPLNNPANSVAGMARLVAKLFNTCIALVFKPLIVTLPVALMVLPETLDVLVTVVLVVGAVVVLVVLVALVLGVVVVLVTLALV